MALYVPGPTARTSARRISDSEESTESTNAGATPMNRALTQSLKWTRPAPEW